MKGTKKKPLVSFVIRTKNEERYVGKVLSLLFKQTFKNFEIIIVDSGSTDRTLQIVKNFPVKIIHIPQKQFTYGRALNLGISKSKGKYICIISGHSIPITNHWLEDGLEVIKEKNVAGLNGYYSSFGLGYFNRFLGKLEFIYFPYFKKREDYNPWLSNTNSLIKKEFWNKYKFDEDLPGCEDYDWASQMIFCGLNIVKMRDFSVFHSHRLIGKPVYQEMVPIWKRQIALVDKKVRKNWIKK